MDLAPACATVAGMILENVSVSAQANIYFDGKVVSHSLTMADGTKKTVGVIFPGQYHFNTDSAECMEICAGTCAVALAGEDATQNFAAGQAFHVPAKSGFAISVEAEPCHYICSFLP